MNLACFVSFMTSIFLKLGHSRQYLSYQDSNFDVLH